MLRIDIYSYQELPLTLH